MKTGPDAISTTENVFGSPKHEKTPMIPSKMCSGARNITTGPDALGTAENESGCAKHENGTRRSRRRPRNRRIRVRECKT
jgi:hypothetical protein